LEVPQAGDIMSEFYKQCKLTRNTTSEVAWIPERFAVVGKYLEIQDDNGWQVSSVSNHRVDGVYLKEHERNYLTQRAASDI